MQLLQLSSILQTGGQFSAESPGQFKAESVVSFPRNVVVNISEISNIWQIGDTEFSLQIELSEYPSREKRFSINPYYFLRTIGYN